MSVYCITLQVIRATQGCLVLDCRVTRVTEGVTDKLEQEEKTVKKERGEQTVRLGHLDQRVLVVTQVNFSGTLYYDH